MTYSSPVMCFFFFFNDTATTEIYTYGHTLSLHDALPIFLLAVIAQLQRQRLAGAIARLGQQRPGAGQSVGIGRRRIGGRNALVIADVAGHERSEEHTSELQSLMRISYAVFCLKKKNMITSNIN